MSEYALTEKEEAWLDMKHQFLGVAPCGVSWELCALCDHPFDPYFTRTNGKCPLTPDYRDAAEFEARAKVKMANKPIKSKPCAYGKCPRDYKTCPFFEMQGDVSLPFCRLLCVHIAVEQEMDESCPKN